MDIGFGGDGPGTRVEAEPVTVTDAASEKLEAPRRRPTVDRPRRPHAAEPRPLCARELRGAHEPRPVALRVSPLSPQPAPRRGGRSENDSDIPGPLARSNLTQDARHLVGCQQTT